MKRLEIWVTQSSSGDGSSRNKAGEIALKYLPFIGKMPRFLLSELRYVVIDKMLLEDDYLYAGREYIVIFEELADHYIENNNFEEILLYLLTQATINPVNDSNRSSPINLNEWIEAGKKDDGIVSECAKEDYSREDLAETLPIYLALKYRRDRLKEIAHINKANEEVNDDHWFDVKEDAEGFDECEGESHIHIEGDEEENNIYRPCDNPAKYIDLVSTRDFFFEDASQNALQRARELGCQGYHLHFSDEDEDVEIFRPCSSKEEYITLMLDKTIKKECNPNLISCDCSENEINCDIELEFRLIEKALENRFEYLQERELFNMDTYKIK